MYEKQFPHAPLNYKIYIMNNQRDWITSIFYSMFFVGFLLTLFLLFVYLTQ